MPYIIKNRETREALTQSFATHTEAEGWIEGAELRLVDWEVLPAPFAAPRPFADLFRDHAAQVAA